MRFFRPAPTTRAIAAMLVIAAMLNIATLGACAKDPSPFGKDKVPADPAKLVYYSPDGRGVTGIDPYTGAVEARYPTKEGYVKFAAKDAEGRLFLLHLGAKVGEPGEGIDLIGKDGGFERKLPTLLNPAGCAIGKGSGGEELCLAPSMSYTEDGRGAYGLVRVSDGGVVMEAGSLPDRPAYAVFAAGKFFLSVQPVKGRVKGQLVVVDPALNATVPALDFTASYPDEPFALGAAGDTLILYFTAKARLELFSAATGKKLSGFDLSGLLPGWKGALAAGASFFSYVILSEEGDPYLVVYELPVEGSARGFAPVLVPVDAAAGVVGKPVALELKAGSYPAMPRYAAGGNVLTWEPVQVFSLGTGAFQGTIEIPPFLGSED